MKRFSKSFTQQQAISEQAISAANAVLRSGRLHRYNTQEGELSEVDLLEIEFADYMQVPFCLACASGGYALHIALRAAGVKSGDKVLSNAFTLAPVPGAIDNCGAVPVLVDVDENYCIDLDDLESKAADPSTKYLMLSHMRGHMADMGRVMQICRTHELILSEDCAHTMGASWQGRKSGLFGDVACFSTQTYKHINSGEGGLLISQDQQIMARAIVLSGSYMLFGQHQAAPPKQAFDEVRFVTPNYSGRMDNLRAAILRPQLLELDQQCLRWNALYAAVEAQLKGCPKIHIPTRPGEEQFVGSSIQFSLPNFGRANVLQVIEQCDQRGVSLKWFGDAEPKGYTSRYDSWRYIDELPELGKTKLILSTLIDMRIPLTFNQQDCRLIGEIIVDVVNQISPVQLAK